VAKNGDGELFQKKYVFCDCFGVGVPRDLFISSLSENEAPPPSPPPLAQHAGSHYRGDFLEETLYTTQLFVHTHTNFIYFLSAFCFS